MSVMPLDWRLQGACTLGDLSLFFGPEDEPDADRQVREAKAEAICQECPVRRECLSYAVTTAQKSGYWGGVGEVERARIRRNYLQDLRGCAA